MFISFWASLDAIRRFAGDNVDRAVYYPIDHEFLLTMEATVRHYEVALNQAPAATLEAASS